MAVRIDHSNDMTTRPTITVYNLEGDAAKTVKTPCVLKSPIRPDLVREVHSNVAKNKRQAYAVVIDAGYQSSAASWGTGRAVARIPRVAGGGTHRCGQGAFGNMCRGGGMFNPNVVWRRWHRKVNKTQKRHAIASALAASAIPALVQARGHRLDDVPELPLVLSDDVESLSKTRDAISLLSKIGLDDDLKKVADSKKVRTGRGKNRNRRYVMRRGPLIIYNTDDGITRAFRNIPGVDLCHVSRMSLLQLAPGGSIGRLVIFTESAFVHLGPLFGNYKSASIMKKNYHLPRPAMENADLARIINSDEIQSVVNPAKQAPQRVGLKKNALTNRSVLGRVNPAALHKKNNAALEKIQGTPQHEALQQKKRKRQEDAKKHHGKAQQYFSDMTQAFQDYAAELPLKKRAGAVDTESEAQE